MSVILQGPQLRTLLLGDQVVKSAQSLPAGTTATLFTVNSGNLIVTSLFGVVSTVIQTQACTIALGLHPTAGTAETAGVAAASASISAYEVGTWLFLQAATESSGTWAAGQLASGGHAGVPAFATYPFTAGPGTITWTTSATNTGAISWYATYIPLDTGAYLS
jgi:hypothetical protein